MPRNLDSVLFRSPRGVVRADQSGSLRNQEVLASRCNRKTFDINQRLQFHRGRSEFSPCSTPPEFPNRLLISKRESGGVRVYFR